MKRSDLPSLDDLRAFEAVGRLGSVRAAAEELVLTHSAVSRRVSKLAQDLGMRLLEPDGRGIRLTTSGEKLAQAATRAIELVSSAVEEMRAATPMRALLLSCERSVAMRWLIPRLSAFQDRYPTIDLHLSVGGGSLETPRERVTLAIRRLDFPIHVGWIVTELMDEEMGPVMQPGMFDRFLTGDYVALGAKTRPDAWRRWSEMNPDAPAPSKTRFMDHHFLIAEAAANGLGVAMCPKIVAVDDLKNNRLIAPMAFTPDGSKYGLLQTSKLVETIDLIRLKNWLIALTSEFIQDHDRN